LSEGSEFEKSGRCQLSNPLLPTVCLMDLHASVNVPHSICYRITTTELLNIVSSYFEGHPSKGKFENSSGKENSPPRPRSIRLFLLSVVLVNVY
jgi:hypothetical protein